MNAFARRGACPGLSAPMATGDGLLVRFTPADAIGLRQLSALCAAARQHGNGTIEITARGSVQVRGLVKHSAPEFALAISNLGIAAEDGINIVTDPLAGDPDAIIDSRKVAAELRRALACVSLEVSPKVSVVVDAGSRLHLDRLGADIRLSAIGLAQSPLLHVSMGGDAASASALGAVPLNRASATVLALLGAIAARGREARAADILRDDGVQHLRSILGDDLRCAPGPHARRPAEAIGRHPLRDGSLALGIGLPFGHADAGTLAELARAAAGHGVQSVRPAPDRALLLLGVCAENAAALCGELRRLGMIVSPDDLRRRIVACPGKPACSSGFIAARALAAEVGQHLGRSCAGAHDDGGVCIHISGCAKGCAHPMPAALTVVGTERGCGIVHQGLTRAAPESYVDPADLVTEIARITRHTQEAPNA